MAEKKPQIAENGQSWHPSSPNGAPLPKPKVQSTISSFFKPKAPVYAMAPGSPPPAQSISIGDMRGVMPSFRVGAHNKGSATVAARSPERGEDWVSLSPPKVDQLDIGGPSNGDGAGDNDVVALAGSESTPESPSTQLRQETLAASMPIRRSPAAKSIDSRAQIVPIQPGHVTSIKRINGLLLCISYPPWFYQQLSPPTSYASYSRAILWSDKPGSPYTVIGSLITRRDPVTEFKRDGKKEGVEPDDTALYIAALTLLSPYRSKGLAQAALESVIRQIVSTPATQEEGGIQSLYAHVWTENNEGLEWYRKMGFHKEGKPVEGYYQKLQPSTAWVLRRNISVLDVVEGQRSLSTIAALAESQRTEDMLQSQLLKRPSAGTARSFMSKGPENEWNDLPEHMVIPRSGPPSTARTPGASAPPSGPPSRAPSAPPMDGLMTPGLGPAGLMGAAVGEGSGVATGVGKARIKKKSRAYAPAAINGDLVNGSSASGRGSQM